MKKHASKKAAAKSSGKSSNKTTEAPVAVMEAPAPTPTPAPAPAPVANVSTKLTGEHLIGQTKDGLIDVVVKRRQLKTESKVGLIKRLLMTPGQTKDTIFAAARPMHAGSDKSLVNTINTVRADLKRALGGLVVATGWKTDAKEGKLATAAVAKLRTHEVGVSAFAAGVVPVELKPKAAKPKAETPATPGAPSDAEVMDLDLNPANIDDADGSDDDSGDDDDSGE